MEITSESKIDEVLKISPKVAKVFKAFGLSCPGCYGVAQDTIAHVVVNNGLDQDEFLKALNESL